MNNDVDKDGTVQYPAVNEAIDKCEAAISEEDLVIDVLSMLGHAINNNAKNKGFYDPPPELDALEDILQDAPMDGVAKSAAMDLIQKLGKRNKGEMIALKHSELSEMLEATRDVENPQSVKIPGFTLEEEELADLMIRALDYAHQHELRIGAAIVAKHKYNTGRPYKHGRKF